jgi:hypothetical protein
MSGRLKGAKAPQDRILLEMHARLASDEGRDPKYDQGADGDQLTFAWALEECILLSMP